MYLFCLCLRKFADVINVPSASAEMGYKFSIIFSSLGTSLALKSQIRACRTGLQMRTVLVQAGGGGSKFFS